MHIITLKLPKAQLRADLGLISAAIQHDELRANSKASFWFAVGRVSLAWRVKPQKLFPAAEVRQVVASGPKMAKARDSTDDEKIEIITRRPEISQASAGQCATAGFERSYGNGREVCHQASGDWCLPVVEA